MNLSTWHLGGWLIMTLFPASCTCYIIFSVYMTHSLHPILSPNVILPVSLYSLCTCLLLSIHETPDPTHSTCFSVRVSLFSVYLPESLQQPIRHSHLIPFSVPVPHYILCICLSIFSVYVSLYYLRICLIYSVYT